MIRRYFVLIGHLSDSVKYPDSCLSDWVGVCSVARNVPQLSGDARINFCCPRDSSPWNQQSASWQWYVGTLHARHKYATAEQTAETNCHRPTHIRSRVLVDRSWEVGSRRSAGRWRVQVPEGARSLGRLAESGACCSCRRRLSNMLSLGIETDEARCGGTAWLNPRRQSLLSTPVHVIRQLPTDCRYAMPLQTTRRGAPKPLATKLIFWITILSPKHKFFIYIIKSFIGKVIFNVSWCSAATASMIAAKLLQIETLLWQSKSLCTVH